MSQPSPDWNLVTLKWAGTYLDGSPCDGSLSLTYAGSVMLDDDPTSPVNIYPTAITVPLSVTTLTINGVPQQVGYAEVQVPASNDPDIQGAGGTYTVTETLKRGGGRTATFVADINAPGGVIWLNKVIPTNPSSGNVINVVYYSDFTALQGRVSTLETAGYATGTDVSNASTADRDRANHTGTQLASTISDLETAVAGMLMAGTNVTLTNNGTAVTISAAGGGGSTLQTASALVYSSAFPGTIPAEDTAHGIYVCTGIGDQTKINAAITFAGAGGHVMLLGPSFSINGTIALKTGVWLSGGGLGTVITAASDFTTGMVTLNDTSVHATTLSNLTLNGNGHQVHGVYYFSDGTGTFTATPSTSPDPAHLVHDLYITKCGTATFAGHGMRLSGGNLRACKYTNIRILACSGVGVWCDGNVDSHFTNVEVGSSGSGGPAVSTTSSAPVGQGFFVGGANLMFVDCKGWYSRADGFYNAGVRNNYTGCQAQDNYGYGFRFYYGKCTIANCHADSNGQAVGAGGLGQAGFWIGSDSLSVTGCQAYDRGGQAWQQQYGFQITAGMTYGRITGCSTYGNATGSQTGTAGAGVTVDIGADVNGK